MKTFSNILPTSEQTYLLRACLWRGEPGRKAWDKWRNLIGDPIKKIREDMHGARRLLPLLLIAARSNNVSMEKLFLTCLRTAYFREELRAKSYWQICKNVLSALNTANLNVILHNGAALAKTVYRDPVLRHCHDIDILLAESCKNRGSNLLYSLAFKSLGNKVRSDSVNLKFEHETGLPLELHLSLLPISYYKIPFEKLWARCQINNVEGVKSHILSPADSLMQVCGLAFGRGNGASLNWVCDAWFIINRYPNLDWDLLLECARYSQIEIPLLTTLRYLAEQLRAPIPSIFLHRLKVASSKSNKYFPV